MKIFSLAGEYENIQRSRIIWKYSAKQEFMKNIQLSRSIYENIQLSSRIYEIIQLSSRIYENIKQSRRIWKFFATQENMKILWTSLTISVWCLSLGLGAFLVERSFFPENERNDQERSHRFEKITNT